MSHELPNRTSAAREGAPARLETEERIIPPGEATPLEQRKTLRATVVNLTHLTEQQVRTKADREMTAKPEEMKGIKNFFVNRIWKHGLARGYYRQQEMTKARKVIHERGNLYAAENPEVEQSVHDEAMKAVMTRFTTEGDELLDTNRGESKRVLGSTMEERRPGSEAVDLNYRLKSAVESYAMGRMGDADFEEEKKRILADVRRIDGSKEDAMYADNFLEIAKQAKQAVKHGTALDQLDIDCNITIGQARDAVRTEAKYDMTDRIIDRLQKVPILRNVMSEAALSSTVAIAVGAAAFMARRLTSSRLMAWGSFGATAVFGAGIIAAGESKRQKDDRAQHARERAQGRDFDHDNAPRRTEMEKYMYEMRSASELSSGLRTALYGAGGTNEQHQMSREDIQRIVQHLSEIEARTEIMDRLDSQEQRKIDLIAYSDVTKIEQERLELKLLQVEAKKRLQHIEGDDRQFAQAALQSSTNQEITRLLGAEGEGGIRDTDRLFNKMRHGKVLKAAALGGLIGLGAGAAGQELAAYFTADQTGFVEHLTHGMDVKGDGSHHLTVLEGIRGLFASHAHGGGPAHAALLDHWHGKLPEGMSDARFTLPKEMNMAFDGHGGYNLTQNGHVLVGGLHLDEHGAFTPESVHALHHEGINAFASPSDQVEVTHDGTLNDQQFADKYGHHVSRDLWYDNDTPKPVFDLNEKKLWWGGDHNIGKDAAGNYTFTMWHMTEDGSFHDQFAAHAHELAKGGHMKLLLSISQDTQSHPIEVDIDADGTVHIPQGSEAAKLFTTDAHGHAVFNGRFAEVAEVMNTAKDGTDHVRILATHVGKGMNSIVDQVKSYVSVPHNTLTAPSGYTTDPFIPLPMWFRTPLEPVTRRAPAPAEVLPASSYGYGYYGEGLKRDYTDLSRLRNSPETLSKLEQRLRGDKVAAAKYPKVFARLDALRRFDSLTDDEKKPLLEAHEKYNKRYGAIPLDEFINRERDRMQRQVENIAIEEAKVGEKPFDKKFYEESQLVRGFERANEFVIYMPDAIGDAVLTVPAIDAISRYLELNSQYNKKLVLVTRHTELLGTLANQYEGLTVVNALEAKRHFSSRKNPNRFIVNAHMTFDQYDQFGLTPEEANDPSRVMSVDWFRWQPEECPVSDRLTKRYYKIPARIARNFEVMLGQKLYPDINATDHYIERGKNFKKESSVIRKKYGIDKNAKLFVISAGASVTPKEYQPQKWEQVFRGIFQKIPNAHIILLDDPSANRRNKYGKIADKLSGEGLKISRANERMDKMNTMMSMADYVLTPDTGLGHYAGAVGTPAVMLFLSNPALWSTPGTRPVMHPMAAQQYRQGQGLYDKAWRQDTYSAGESGEYFINDDGVLIGASDIDPQKVLEKIT